ncbi:MAG: hypothetical protein JWM37_818 [Candidatus Saccharibacteria bacterium]|nr:hypothetical protein [Candidatus Saccharibacteria bacterium]
MKRRLLQYLLLALLIGVSVYGITNAQNIRDAIKLRGYQPSDEIAALPTDTAMTDKARRIFYVNHPAVAAKKAFSNFCEARQEQTIVLGCYHGNQNGIYVLDVTDGRLAGVEQVTAAHEMLHAAYDRLSSKQKTAINAQLQDYYDNHLTDSRIKQTIDSYKKTEPHDVVNEMHSIFGTEVASLPPGLEGYYSQYFTDRQVVVKKAAAYETEFSSRRTQIAADDTQLGAWHAQIERQQAELSSMSDSISTDRNRLDGYRSGGNAAAYNAAVPAYNAKVDLYNRKLASLRGLITKYNDLVDERNQLANQIDDLVQAISSSDIPSAQ